MVKRYALSDLQWSIIAAGLPGKPGAPGRSGADNRRFVNGVMCVLRPGARRHHPPARYGMWKTVRKRFTRRAKAGDIACSTTLVRAPGRVPIR